MAEVKMSTPQLPRDTKHMFRENTEVTFNIDALLTTETLKATLEALITQTGAKSRNGFVELHSMKTGEELCEDPATFNYWINKSTLPREIAVKLEAWVYQTAEIDAPPEQQQLILSRFYEPDGNRPMQGYG